MRGCGCGCGCESSPTADQSLHHSSPQDLQSSGPKLESKPLKSLADAQPVIAIIGSTGTGKSQLGVEIAQYLLSSSSPSSSSLSSSSSSSSHRAPQSCRIISADSMQIYRGLDVISNKATSSEMSGVPHELMSFLDVDEDYDVGRFIRDAKRIGEECVQEDQMPIVVGGAIYYVQHLLFPGDVVGAQQRDEAKEGMVEGDGEEEEEVEKQHGLIASTRRPRSPSISAALESMPPALSPTWSSVLASNSNTLPDNIESEELWALLDHLDPLMAKRWHPRDARKIFNSLRVIIETGRRHSSWVKDQEGNHATSRGESKQQAAELLPQPTEATAEGVTHWSGRPLRVLIFWVWASRLVLYSRLDGRVDKMIERGLFDEIRELRERARSQGGKEVFTKGIYQSIGYKEFKAFLDLLDSSSSPSHGTPNSTSPHDSPRIPRSSRAEEIAALPAPLRTLFEEGLTSMKTATRRYARKQIQWIRHQLLPEITKRRAKGQDVSVVLLDTGDVEQWDVDVRQRAEKIVDIWLRGEDIEVSSHSALIEPSQVAQVELGDILPRRHRPNAPAPLVPEDEDGTATASSSNLSSLEANTFIQCQPCTEAAKVIHERHANRLLSTPSPSTTTSTATNPDGILPPPKPVYYRQADASSHLHSRAHQNSIRRLQRGDLKKLAFLSGLRSEDGGNANDSGSHNGNIGADGSVQSVEQGVDVDVDVEKEAQMEKFKQEVERKRLARRIKKEQEQESAAAAAAALALDKEREKEKEKGGG